ncbi:PAS domain-containing protein [Deinococcus sp. SM5_A1]|uniref:PAS domain-containing protein n=1 Tax=Deinococcus sp. SM5_A1 TaxID=3379094 RepID=UPI0038593610
MTHNSSQSAESDRTTISALIEALPQPVVVTDKHGGIRHVNERWLTLTGLNRAAAAGQHWLDLQAPEDHAAAARAWAQARLDAQPFDASYAMHAASGRVTVQWNCAPLRADGAVTGWMCTGVPPGEARFEIESQEETLEHLALEVNWLGDILAHLPLGVLTVDAQTHRIRLVNTQAQRLLGMTLAPGMTLARLEELQLTADRLPLRRALDGVLVSGEELEVRRPDGSCILLRVSAAPVPDSSGEPVAAVMTLEDVTTRREGSERERLNAEVQRAQEAVLLHGGEPVTPERFLTLMGELHEQLGFPSLEGRLIALLLLRAEPVSLGEAAIALEVSKVAVSKVSAVMQGRGDLQVIKSFSSREHLLALTDHNYVRDLSVRRVGSWAISILCESLLRTNNLDPAITQQIRTHLETHTRVAVALERVLSPIERRQAQALATHLRENWDAVPAPHEKPDTDPENPD